MLIGLAPWETNYRTTVQFHVPGLLSYFSLICYEIWQFVIAILTIKKKNLVKGLNLLKSNI